MNKNTEDKNQTAFNNDKSISFMNRFEQFETVSTLAEAQELAQKIMPTYLERTRFCIGKLKITIINRKNCFRISVDSEEEFKCYDFS